MRFLLLTFIGLLMGFIQPVLSQTVEFKARLDEIWFSTNWTPTMKFQTRIGTGSYNIANECFGMDLSSNLNRRWLSSSLRNYSANTACGNINSPCRIIHRQNVSLGSNFNIRFQGYRHTDEGRCSKADDDICGWTDNTLSTEIYYYNEVIRKEGIMPGGWKQFDSNDLFTCYTSQSGGGNNQYRYRVSLFLAAPIPTITSAITSNTLNGTQTTNFCLNDEDVYIRFTDNRPGVIEHSEIEYVWQYNRNNQTYVADNICSDLVYIGAGKDFECFDYTGPRVGCLPEGRDPDCWRCDDCEEIREDVWYSAGKSDTKGLKFSPPSKGSYKFRVAIGNKTTGIVGEYSAANANVQVYDPAPQITYNPSSNSNFAITAANAGLENNGSLDIQHVQCHGETTASVTIKSVAGGGQYYYYVRKLNGTTMPINGTLNALPVKFPDDVLNNNGFQMGVGEYELRIENLDQNAFGETQRRCFSTYYFTIKEPTDLTMTVNNPNATNRNNFYITCKGESDGQVQLSASGGNGSYNYHLYESDRTTQLQTNTTGLFTELSEKQYAFKVEDAFDCASLWQTISITAPPNPLTINSIIKSNPDQPYNILCSVESNGEISATVSGGINTKNYEFILTNESNTSTSLNGSSGEIVTFNNLSSGFFDLTVTDDNGCSVTTNNIELTKPAPLSINYTAVPPTCLNGSDGEVTIIPAGGISQADGNYKVYVNGQATDPQKSKVGASVTLTDFEPGIYSIVVEAAHSCEKNFTITIPEQPNPVRLIEFPTVQSPTCYEGNDGLIQFQAIGGVPIGSAYAYELSGVNIDTTFTVSGAVSLNRNIFAGSYSLKISDANSCQSFTSGIIVPLKEPIIWEVLKRPNLCKDDQNGELELTLRNGTSPYHVVWRDNESNILLEETVSDASTLSNLREGIYFASIQDANGCTNNLQELIIPVNLDDPEYVVLNIQLLNEITCYRADDAVLRLFSTGGSSGIFEYSMDGETYSTSNSFENLGPGDYTFYTRDMNGCTGSAMISIMEPQPLSAESSSFTNLSCFESGDGKVTINASGGAGDKTFSIDGTNYSANNTFSGLPSGNYIFSVLDANNCYAAVPVIITEPSLLSLAVTDVVNATCGEPNGQATVEASGGTAPYIYQWTNTSGTVVGNGANLINVGGGVYTLLITDANGCTDTEQAIITSPDGAQISIDQLTSTTCFDTADGKASISISGFGPFEVDWGNGETGTTAVNLVAGLNTVSITDNNGCVVVEQIDVTSPDPLSLAVAESIIPTCFTSLDGSLSVAISGGTGTYDVLWSTGATSNSLSNIGSGAYSITVTDENGCELTQEVVLEEKHPVGLEITEMIAPSCEGNSDGSLTITATGGNGGYSYLWDNGATSNTLPNITAGKYSVLIIDEKGCTHQQIITFQDAAPFEILVNNVIEICTGSSYFTNYNIPGAINYNWSSDNGFESNERVVELVEPGIYQLTIENENGCIATKDFELIVSNDLLSADMIMATEAFVGDTVMIIDISWPIPDSVYWQFPKGTTVLEENGEYASVIFTELGLHDLSIEIAQAECRDFYTQSISILPVSEREESNQRIFDSPEKLIKSLDVFPNPAIRDFKMNVELSQNHDISLKMIDLSGNQVILNEQFTGKDYYSIPVEITLNPGVYIISLQVGKESTYKRIVIR